MIIFYYIKQPKIEGLISANKFSLFLSRLVYMLIMEIIPGLGMADVRRCYI